MAGALESGWLVVSLFAGLGLLGAAAAFVLAWRRSNALHRIAQQEGWEDGSPWTDQIRQQIEQFPLGLPLIEIRLTNIFRIPHPRFRILLFDCSVVPGGTIVGKSPRWNLWNRQTAAWIRVRGLKTPQFILGANGAKRSIFARPERLKSKLAQLPGFWQMQLKAPPEFHEKFALLAMNQSEASRFFTEDTLRRLGDMEPFQFDGGFFSKALYGVGQGTRFQPILEGADGGLLFYFGGVIVPPHQISEFAARAMELAGNIHHQAGERAVPVRYQVENSRWIAECPDCRQRHDVTAVLGDDQFDVSAEPGQQMICVACSVLFGLGEKRLEYACPDCGAANQTSLEPSGKPSFCQACGRHQSAPAMPESARAAASLKSAESGPVLDRHHPTVLESGSPSVRRVPRWAGWMEIAFGVAWLAFLLPVLAGHLRTVMTQAATKSWTATEGQIIATRVESRIGRSPGGRIGGGGRFTYFVPQVTYKYSVGRNAHIGTQLQIPELTFRTQERAQAFLREAGLESGKQTAVYFNPGRPSESVLRISEPEDFLSTILLFPFCGIGFWVLWRGYKHLKAAASHRG